MSVEQLWAKTIVEMQRKIKELEDRIKRLEDDDRKRRRKRRRKKRRRM